MSQSTGEPSSPVLDNDKHMDLLKEPEELARMKAEVSHFRRKLKQQKWNLWIDQVSLFQRNLLEPYELKPVLPVIGSFFGLFLGFLAGFSVIGFWIGFVLGLIASAGLLFFFIRTLYWGDLETIKKSCDELPGLIEATAKEYDEKKYAYEFAHKASVEENARNNSSPETARKKNVLKGGKDQGRIDKKSKCFHSPNIVDTKNSPKQSTTLEEQDCSGSRKKEWRTCSPAEFRVFVEAAFRNLGYKIQIPQKDTQLGVHLIVYHPAQRIVVKLVSEPIQVTQGAVQQVFSAKTHLECDSALVITPGTFSLEARKLGRSTKTNLVGQMEMQKFLDGKVYPKIVS